MQNEFESLTYDEFIFLAKKSYQNEQCLDYEEFYKDIISISTIGKLFKKYRTFGVINERLIINYIIILSNVFGTRTAVKMLLARIDKDSLYILRTFLKYLQYHNDDNPFDIRLWKKLQNL